MKTTALIAPILVICFSIFAGCAGQANKEPSETPAVKKATPETVDCWQEFKDSTANISVKFCGEPRKDILDDTFKGKNVKRNSYLVLNTIANGNARYFLGWFDWKLNSEDADSLRKFYDEYSKDMLDKGSNGSIKETKEITLNGKIGRETTFVSEDSNSLTIRVFYSNGKVVYASFLPEKFTSDRALQDNSRKIFFESYRISETK